MRQHVDMYRTLIAGVIVGDDNLQDSRSEANRAESALSARHTVVDSCLATGPTDQTATESGPRKSTHRCWWVGGCTCVDSGATRGTRNEAYTPNKHTHIPIQNQYHTMRMNSVAGMAYESRALNTRNHTPSKRSTHRLPLCHLAAPDEALKLSRFVQSCVQATLNYYALSQRFLDMVDCGRTEIKSETLLQHVKTTNIIQVPPNPG